ncbi:hypothetical protein QBC35DRAFT_530963 [Podospora australis]|uniref:Uncharacterized protein n=1 Tax=Podospora australis TaxID=1536484 RepID=A0AAN6X0E6_9PEZI|nr:hypothetical protein QBC35DRAFT_530963 [Podospora australis]
MSANILISNGTCYSSAGEKLDPAHFIPCGNSAFGHTTCCGVGDNCLAQNACFGYHGTGYGSALTYQVGCTDPDYKHSSCPDKKGIDQGPWIALTLCDNSDGIWAPCPQEGSPTTLRPGSYCSCTDASKTTAAFDDNTVLANIAALPRTEGGSISFFPGHEPTQPPNPPPAQTTGGNNGGGGGQSSTGGGNGGGSSNGGSSGPSQTGTNGSPAPSMTGTGTNTGPAVTTGTNTDPAASGDPSGQPSNSDDPQNASSGGLNSGAKIGIGIGAAIGGLILIAVLVLLFLSNRKRRNGRLSADQDMAENGSSSGATAAGMFGLGKKGHNQRYSDTSTIPSGVSEADGQPLSEAGGKAVSKPYLGNRTELDGREVHNGAGRNHANGHPMLTPVAELPGSEPFPTMGR